MALERILVGDDQVDFAKKNFPFIPDAEIEFVNNPNLLIEKAKTGQYSIVVTDLNYTENGEEGFNVLKELQNISGRKILWTGNAYDPNVKEKAVSLGAEVLDKDEIGTLVGQVVSKAPLKQNGKVLIFVPKNSGTIAKALEQVVKLFWKPEEVKISSELKEELTTGKYGLVIDASTMLSQGSRTGVVAHDMKYLKLSEVPKVRCVYDVTKAVAEIAIIISNFYKK